MSIISCTSPRPSETILPASSVTTAPSAAFDARNSSPSRRTSSPRRGAGTSRQAAKAAFARAIVAGASLAGVSAMRAISLPSIGLRTDSVPPESSASEKPAARSTSCPVRIGSLHAPQFGRYRPQMWRKGKPRGKAREIYRSRSGLLPDCRRSPIFRSGGPAGSSGKAMARYSNIVLGCVAMLVAAALAYVMAPHKLMARANDNFSLEANIPYSFGQWRKLPGVEAIRPNPSELEKELYSQEVSRVYVDPDGHIIMFMAAYGESQSDRLQMHHPEVCYTAQGFRVSPTKTSKFTWSPDAPPIQLTRLIASREGRLEPISYWMRIGYDNTTSNWERQALKLGYGLRGWIPD